MLSEILNGNGMRHDFNDYVAFMAVAQECSFLSCCPPRDLGIHAFTHDTSSRGARWHAVTYAYNQAGGCHRSR